MTDNTTPREAIAKVLSAEKCKPHKRQMIDGITDATWCEADAVIAHLWQAADDPAVMRQVADELNFYLLPEDGTSEEATRAAITTLLTALLGPNPNEQEAER